MRTDLQSLPLRSGSVTGFSRFIRAGTVLDHAPGFPRAPAARIGGNHDQRERQTFGVISTAFGAGALLGALVTAALGRAPLKAMMAGAGLLHRGPVRARPASLDECRRRIAVPDRGLLHRLHHGGYLYLNAHPPQRSPKTTAATNALPVAARSLRATSARHQIGRVTFSERTEFAKCAAVEDTTSKDRLRAVRPLKRADVKKYL